MGSPIRRQSTLRAPDPGADWGSDHPDHAEGFIRQAGGLRGPGRPRLDIPLERIIEAVRGTGQAVSAARQLGCSDAYLRVNLRRAGLTLRQVLDAPDAESLLATKEASRD